MGSFSLEGSKQYLETLAVDFTMGGDVPCYREVKDHACSLRVNRLHSEWTVS